MSHTYTQYGTSGIYILDPAVATAYAAGMTDSNFKWLVDQLENIAMKNIWISSTPQTPTGTTALDITLADETNWNVQYAYISSIKVSTVSTNWNMWLCETSAFNTALITSRQIVANRNGNFDISVAREYNSDAVGNVYLKYTDNAPGGSAATIYIVGSSRGH